MNVGGLSLVGETDKRLNKKEREDFICAVCPCIFLSAVRRPPSWGPCTHAHPAPSLVASNCSATTILPPTFLPHLLKALGQSQMSNPFI